MLEHMQYLNNIFEDFNINDGCTIISPEIEEEIQQKSHTNLFKIPNYLEKVNSINPGYN
jgi:hypothetical protein